MTIKSISKSVTIFILGVLLGYIFSRTAILVEQKPVNNLTKKYSSLSKISTEVQIDYLKKYLSKPIIINYSSDRKTKEYIFVDIDYYVQIITNSDDKVLAYAVTTRKKDFNPAFSIGDVEVQLGITKFYTDKNPINCFGLLGNTAPTFYFERYPGWNGTNYQDYLYGYNTAGYRDTGLEGRFLIPILSDGIFLKDKKGYPEYDCNSIPQEFRMSFPINTFMVVKDGLVENASIFNNPQFDLGVNRRVVELIKE